MTDERSSHRGHAIELRSDVWVYVDTGLPVADDPWRTCGSCKQPNRVDGHDACLGELSGVMNACCGHGSTREAYVQWSDGVLVSGLLAVFVQRRLKSHQGAAQKPDAPHS